MDFLLSRHLIRTDSIGDTLWTRYYEQEAIDGVQLENGDYVLISSYFHNDSTDLQLWSVDDDGNELWINSYSNFYRHNPMNIIKSSNNEIFVSSRCQVEDSYPTRNIIWLTKFDLEGNFLSDGIFLKGDYQNAYGLIESLDRNIVLFGHYSVGSPMLGDLWLLKTTSNCDSIWSKEINTPEREVGLDITELLDGSFATVGYRQVYPLDNSTPQLLFTKFSPEGDYIEEIQLDHVRREIGQDIEWINNEDYVILSGLDPSNSNESRDIRLLALRSSSVGISNNYVRTSQLLLANPNPTNGNARISIFLPQKTRIEVNIFNIKGRVMFSNNSHVITAGEKIFNINTDEYASGVYFYTIQTDYSNFKGKMSIVK